MNTLFAFQRSLRAGFGFETDVRDFNGRLVISHDPPHHDAIDLSTMLRRVTPLRFQIALNVKSDGLAAILDKEISRFRLKERVFYFDMSVPNMISFLKKGMKVFTRLSDVEPIPVLVDKAAGVWIDGFNRDWGDFPMASRLIRRKKELVFVSPELHGRPHLGFWQRLSKWGDLKSSLVHLCTDFPETARSFFGENQR